MAVTNKLPGECEWLSINTVLVTVVNAVIVVSFCLMFFHEDNIIFIM